jgi:hypothetical protein
MSTYLPVIVTTGTQGDTVDFTSTAIPNSEGEYSTYTVYTNDADGSPGGASLIYNDTDGSGFTINYNPDGSESTFYERHTDGSYLFEIYYPNTGSTIVAYYNADHTLSSV